MNRENFPLTFSRTDWPFTSLVIVAATLVALRRSVTNAHGIIGYRTFLSPIVGNDAFPDNALDLTTRRSDYEFSILLALQKQLTDNSSLLVTSSWHRVTPGAGQHDEEGFGDLSLY